tara:strand:+ start:327 stop:509 length:183 start_codon:yes stop_codon:yes gene_type:complete
LCYAASITITKHEGKMQKLLNKITYYFLKRAYVQMWKSDNLQNADKIAEHEEDYYKYFVR